MTPLPCLEGGPVTGAVTQPASETPKASGRGSTHCLGPPARRGCVRSLGEQSDFVCLRWWWPWQWLDLGLERVRRPPRLTPKSPGVCGAQPGGRSWPSVPPAHWLARGWGRWAGGRPWCPGRTAARPASHPWTAAPARRLPAARAHLRPGPGQHPSQERPQQEQGQRRGSGHGCAPSPSAAGRRDAGLGPGARRAGRAVGSWPVPAPAAVHKPLIQRGHLGRRGRLPAATRGGRDAARWLFFGRSLSWNYPGRAVHTCAFQQKKKRSLWPLAWGVWGAEEGSRWGLPPGAGQPQPESWGAEPTCPAPASGPRLPGREGSLPQGRHRPGSRALPASRQRSGGPGAGKGVPPESWGLGDTVM